LVYKKKYNFNLDFVKSNKPFNYFYSNSFLPNDVYKGLRDSFPELNHFTEVNKVSKNKTTYESKDGKLVLNTRGEKFNYLIKEMPLWKEFIEKISSDDFLNDMRSIFLNELKETVPDIAEKEWTTDDLKKNDKFAIVKLNCQFSKMCDKSFIEPHKDSATKIISLIFYLPSDDYLSFSKNKKINYGGTNFHRVLRPESEIDERDLYYNFSSDILLEGGVEYQPNTVAGFIRSFNSFHSVGPIKCPKNVYRDAFLINISRVVRPKYKKSNFFFIYKYSGIIKRFSQKILRSKFI